MSGTNNQFLFLDNAYGELMKNELTRLKQSRKPGVVRSRDIYHQILVDHGGTEYQANDAIFKKIGTSKESGYLLGHQDRDCGSGYEGFIKHHFFCILAMLDNYYVVICVGFLAMVGKTAIYVVDIIKDVKFIVLFNGNRMDKSDSDLSGLLDVGLAAAVGFLLASEVVKMLQLYHSEGYSRAQRVFWAFLSPFQLIPILVHHFEHLLDLRLHRLCAIPELTYSQEESLTQTRSEVASVRRLKGEQRSTENVLEHLVQFILSATVLLSLDTPVPNHIFDLSNSELQFSIISSVVSIVSIIRGQVNLISTQKNGQLGLMASCLLALYMIVAIVPRALVILFSIIASYQMTVVTRWKLNYINLYFTFTTIAVVLVHILISYLIQKWLLNGKKSNLKQALWSFLSPPLFLDWDFLYRQEDFEMPIIECWRRTRNSFLLHNFTTLVGNLALGIPLYIWTKSVDYDATILTLSTVITSIVSQAILLGLGFLYFRKKHPWARILNVELAKTDDPGFGFRFLNFLKNIPCPKFLMPSQREQSTTMLETIFVKRRPRRHSIHELPVKMEVLRDVRKLRRRSI